MSATTAARSPSALFIGLSLDKDKQCIECGDLRAHLQPSAINLVVFLCCWINTTVPYASLKRVLYGPLGDNHPEDPQNVLRVHFNRIRRALRDIGAPLDLQTLRGVGVGLFDRNKT